jgi:hypothetical protein
MCVTDRLTAHLTTTTHEPQEPSREEHYLVKLERQLLAKKRVITEQESFWSQQRHEQEKVRRAGTFSWRAVHVKYLQSPTARSSRARWEATRSCTSAWTCRPRSSSR